MKILTLLTPLLLALPASAQPKADHILIEKSHHRMTLYAGPTALRTYQIWLGTSSGPKQKKGDHKTPEGDYLIDNHNPSSNYHRALHLSYPNPQDRARAAQAHVQTGGDIMIHGLPNHTGWAVFGHHLPDWTDGCIAVTDKDIEEIYALVPNGTKVHIEPRKQNRWGPHPLSQTKGGVSSEARPSSL